LLFDWVDLLDVAAARYAPAPGTMLRSAQRLRPEAVDVLRQLGTEAAVAIVELHTVERHDVRVAVPVEVEEIDVRIGAPPVVGVAHADAANANVSVDLEVPGDRRANRLGRAALCAARDSPAAAASEQSRPRRILTVRANVGPGARAGPERDSKH